MLEALGVTGMLRTFMYTATSGRDCDAALAYVEQRLLPNCARLMHYDASRREAEARTTAMAEACARYREERGLG